MSERKALARLNYNHVYYFWMVARDGSVSGAAERLHVTPQTVSGQIRALEESLDAKLFCRNGRLLQLTPAGRLVADYAARMFDIGEQLEGALAADARVAPARFVVGVTMTVPKLIARRVLEPVLSLPEGPVLECREASLEQLAEDLASRRVEVVLADAPMPPAACSSACSQLLGESGLSFFCDVSSAEGYRRDFPGSLDGAPMLVPRRSSRPHGALTGWLRSNGVTPRVVASFDDTALMNEFAEVGAGVLALPTVVENDVLRRHQMSVIGRTSAVRESFYLIATERQLRQPAAQAIARSARGGLFGAP